MLLTALTLTAADLEGAEPAPSLPFDDGLTPSLTVHTGRPTKCKCCHLYTLVMLAKAEF